MAHVALVLGDQLMADNPALDGAGSVVMVESLAVLGRAPLHRSRAQLVLSAMRHHAAALRERGFEVEEIRGAGSFGKALEGVKGELVCAAPNRASARRELEELGVRFVPSNQFLTTPEEFAEWAQGRKAITMEPFYREQRRRYGILVEADGEPVGGR
ncbi:MAG: cryptochrome/photolyase family protein, partial [Solirubrobacterales bacterium]